MARLHWRLLACWLALAMPLCCCAMTLLTGPAGAGPGSVVAVRDDAAMPACHRAPAAPCHADDASTPAPAGAPDRPCQCGKNKAEPRLLEAGDLVLPHSVLVAVLPDLLLTLLEPPQAGQQPAFHRSDQRPVCTSLLRMHCALIV